MTSSLFGQQVDYKVNGGQTNIYNDAIMHYIDSVYNDKSTFDTLFILKNDELTENIIQSVYKKINISFQDSLNISKRLKYHKTLTALNIFSDQNSGKDHIKMLIISFIISKDKGKSNYKPFENCTVRYIFNHSKKEFEFHKIVCDKY